MHGETAEPAPNDGAPAAASLYTARSLQELLEVLTRLQDEPAGEPAPAPGADAVDAQD
jgi:hypothetical protein